MRHSLAALSALAAAPIAAGALALRPARRAGLSERLGALPRLEPGSIWIHGASVGESRVVGRLASALEARDRRVFASAQTLTGREALLRVAPTRPCGLAPLDHPWAIDRALDRIAPAAIVLCETEIWPCWIASAARRGIPVGVVSGRISPGAARRYRWIRPVITRAVSTLDRVGARTQSDADRFLALGAAPERVAVTGDLKLAPPPRPAKLADDLRAALAGRPVLVAGSTHPGEEASALEAFASFRSQSPGAHLVVAPRHPDRFEAVAAAIAAAGRRVRRRSVLGSAPLASGEVLLLDSLGELEAVYGLARGAFVGGSLVPVGGHDPIEALRQGCPVAIGPHHENVHAIVERGVGDGVVTVVHGSEALAAFWRSTLAKPRRAMPGAGDGALADGAAVLERSIALIDGLVDRSRR